MSIRVPKRFAVILPWFQASLRGQTDVSFRDLLAFLRQPPRHIRAQQWIREISEEGDYLKITFNDLDRPLYWPAEEDTWSLWMLLNEQFDINDWHHYEVPETAVGEGDVIVDCGAAEGLFALRTAPRCRRFYALEPNPIFFAALQKTLAGLDNVELLPYAAGRENAEGYLKLRGQWSRIDDTAGHRIQIRTLDSLFLENDPPVTFIKADIEGAELIMLQGAIGILRRYKPKIAITTYHPNNDVQEIITFIKLANPEYQFRLKGINALGHPVMLHAW